MDSTQAVRAMSDASGVPMYKIGPETGRAPTWISATLAKRSSMRVDTLALVADVCGYDLALVDRATGERLGTIDPAPRKDAGQGQEG